MSFVLGFGLALAFVAVAVLGLATWGLYRIALTLSAENDKLAAKIKTLESLVAHQLAPDDVRRLVLEMPARPGPSAVPLDLRPREEMPDQVAADTFKHGTSGHVTMRERIASFEARQRQKAADAKATKQGGPGASE